MFLLILKSSACLAVFMVFYKLFLEKESMHQFKRFYLLSALLVSVIIPFITFTEYIEVEAIQNIVPFHPEAFTEQVAANTKTWQDYIPVVLWSIYAFGVVVFAIRFFKNIIQLIQKIKNNPKLKNQNFINVLLIDLVHPHTFFNYIFFNKTKYEHKLIPNEVLLHEQTHAKEKHALDILFIEILHIIFWFNPLLYFIKKDIKLNHEFLADQAVLKQGVDTKNYQQLLLAFSSNATEPKLANAINYSLIKKRFTVMKTQTSKKAFWLKGLLILPILAILIYGFSEKEIIEKEVASFEALAIQETEKGVTEEMMKEYKAFITKFEDSNTIWMPKLNRAIAIYDLMTDTQRASVKKYPETKLTNLAKVKPKMPTETLFNSWKNKEKFAIWIDGKVVDNSELNKYSASDFKYYTSSFVYNNARSKRFPQAYQNHLYTKKGFEESYLKRSVNNYNSLKNDYLKAKKTFNNSDKKDDSELRILKARLDKLYNSLSKENINKYDVEKVHTKKKAYQQQATPKQVAEYNKLAKHISKQIKNKGTIKLQQAKRLKHLYSLMNDSQKEQAEPYPDLSLLPPPPAPKPVKVEVVEVPVAPPHAPKPPKIKKVSEVVEVPPPPPPVMKKADDNMSNDSKELQKAWKAFKTEGDKYGKAALNYLTNEEGSLSALNKQYKEVMKLYNAYQDIAKKEKALTIPPPPPPVQAPTKKQ